MLLRGKGKKFAWTNHEKMAILESCCGSGLAVSSAVLGVYLLIAYIIAFAIELWWILESPATPPIPAYLLCLGYFILLVFSALLLHGLSVKRTSFLLVWLFMMGILLGPEAGLVLYLSIHYWVCFLRQRLPVKPENSFENKRGTINACWHRPGTMPEDPNLAHCLSDIKRVTSLYGLIEVTCWACRLVVNAIGLLCVQSLHSIWREEKSVLLRLETLKKSPATKIEGRKLGMSAVPYGYRNDGHEVKRREDKVNVDAEGDFVSSHCEAIVKDGDYVDSGYVESGIGREFSEFNASSFDPAIIDARLESMPYLTIRKKPMQSVRVSTDESESIPRTRSLMDLRGVEESSEISLRMNSKRRKHAPPDSERGYKFHAKPESTAGSLDRKIIKNKNLKILKTLSPFISKKQMAVNVYRINPPKQLSSSSLDDQLNKIYTNRGMYTFDEKLKKIVYYPPEFFSSSVKFRKRMDSYGSSQSRSSVDTDSEDLRHISDVAL